mmetsp:Transcript_73428/g.177638  ORF Transcript_73428/g.177638 Transcript_73428/m.177638 type:complete len:307 (-) Transcript_73428:42-962(-)
MNHHVSSRRRPSVHSLRRLPLVRIAPHPARPLRPGRHPPRRRLHVIHPGVIRHGRDPAAALADARAALRPLNVHPLLLEIITRHDVHEEIENIRLRDRRRDVVPLQRPPFVLLAVDPRPQRELEDEHLARLGEQHGRLRRDHPNVLVALHDLLNPRERKLMILEVAPRLDLPHLPLPKRPQLQLMLLRDVMRLHLVRRQLLMLQLRAHGVLLELRLLRRVHVRHPAGLAVPGHAVRRLLVHHLRLAVAVPAAAVPAVVGRVLHSFNSSFSGEVLLSFLLPRRGVRSRGRPRERRRSRRRYVPRARV